MKPVSLGASILTLLALLLGTSAAQAAKGVKKGTQHKHHGVVVAVNHNKKDPHIVIHTRHHHKKKKVAGVAVVPAAAKKKHHQFKAHVKAATVIEVAKRNGNRVPAALANVHRGPRS